MFIAILKQDGLEVDLIIMRYVAMVEITTAILMNVMMETLKMEMDVLLSVLLKVVFYVQEEIPQQQIRVRDNVAMEL